MISIDTTINNSKYSSQYQEVTRKTIIVILNYRTYELTIELIKALRKDQRYADVAIIVVDNDSPGKSAEILERFSSQLDYRFIANKENAGYAAGNNVALRWAFDNGYRYALIINNDIVINSERCEGTLLELAACLESSSDYAVIGPRVLKPSGEWECPVSKRGTLFDLTLGYPLMYLRREAFNVEEHLVPYYRPQGCCMMVKLEDLKQCDYMDESTFLYCEEEILAERLIKIGKLCGYCKDVSIVHNHSVTVRSTFSRLKLARLICKSYGIYLKQYRRFNHIETVLCQITMFIVRLFR